MTGIYIVCKSGYTFAAWSFLFYPFSPFFIFGKEKKWEGL